MEDELSGDCAGGDDSALVCLEHELDWEIKLLVLCSALQEPIETLLLSLEELKPCTAPEGGRKGSSGNRIRGVVGWRISKTPDHRVPLAILDEELVTLVLADIQPALVESEFSVSRRNPRI